MAAEDHVELVAVDAAEARRLLDRAGRPALEVIELFERPRSFVPSLLPPSRIVLGVDVGLSNQLRVHLLDDGDVRYVLAVPFGDVGADPDSDSPVAAAADDHAPAERVGAGSVADVQEPRGGGRF